MGVVGDTECNSIQHAVIAHCAYLETFNLSTVLSTHAFSWLHASTQCTKIPQLLLPIFFLVPKLDGNTLQQDPIVGIVPSKSVMSLTGHPYSDYTLLRRAPCCCLCHQLHSTALM